MRRRYLPLAMALLLAAGACGPAQVVVTAEVSMSNPDGEGMVTNPIADMVVELLPYDRDAIFDSLAAAYGTPEPAIPQELLDAREEVAQAQQRWQQATSRWNTLRDTLQKLNDTMKQYSRGEARYVALFREWQEFDSQYGRVERQMNDSFKEFTDLSRRRSASPTRSASSRRTGATRRSRTSTRSGTPSSRRPGSRRRWTPRTRAAWRATTSR
jgi:hypothetical protein